MFPEHFPSNMLFLSLNCLAAWLVTPTVQEIVRNRLAFVTGEVGLLVHISQVHSSFEVKSLN